MYSDPRNPLGQIQENGDQKKFKLSSLEAQSQPEVILQGLESLLGNPCFRGMGGGSRRKESVEGGRSATLPSDLDFWGNNIMLLQPAPGF